MQIGKIGMNDLLPSTTSTNTGYEGSKIISEDSAFQDALDEVNQRIKSASEIVTMTDEEIAQRNKEIREASTELEAILLKMMMTEMQKTVPKDELFGDDNSMEIWRDMYYEKLSDQAAQAGGIGLADFIYEQLTRKIK